MEENRQKLHDKAKQSLEEALMDDDAKTYIRGALIHYSHDLSHLIEEKEPEPEKVTFVPLEKLMEELPSFIRDKYMLEKYPATRMYIAGILKLSELLDQKDKPSDG